MNLKIVRYDVSYIIDSNYNTMQGRLLSELRTLLPETVYLTQSSNSSYYHTHFYMESPETANIRITLRVSREYASAYWGTAAEYKDSSGTSKTMTSSLNDSTSTSVLEFVIGESILCVGVSGSNELHYSSSIFKFEDRITKEVHYFATRADGQIYWSTASGYVAKDDVLYSQLYPTSGIPYSSIVPYGIVGMCASPMLIAAKIPNVDMSGIPKDLYTIYENGEPRDLGQRYTRFSLNGHKFVSLGRSVAALVD